MMPTIERKDPHRGAALEWIVKFVIGTAFGVLVAYLIAQRCSLDIVAIVISLLSLGVNTAVLYVHFRA